MASSYTVDELDQITATLEHLQDATDLYFDTAEWKARDLRELILATRAATEQLESIAILAVIRSNAEVH